MRPVAGPASVDMLDHGSADYHHSFDDGQVRVAITVCFLATSLDPAGIC